MILKGDVGPDIAINDVMFARRLVSDVANKLQIEMRERLLLVSQMGE